MLPFLRVRFIDVVVISNGYDFFQIDKRDLVQEHILKDYIKAKKKIK